MVLSPRQPGSALKPFLYALAFDRGATPATILPDIAAVYQTGTGPYRPRNYDRRFHGPVRAREALASSYNIPAVELADRYGVGSLLHVLRGAGFGSLGRSADHYGLGLALGNGDITLLELANGYRALVNLGEWRPYTWRAGTPGRVGGESAGSRPRARGAQVLDILADPVARIPGFGVESPLDFPFPVAAKTGTSRHFTDNWAVGATGGFTVAVWVGNFSGRPMDGVSGVSGAGPLLHRAVLATARRYPAGALPDPGSTGAVASAVCRLSGLRPGPACPVASEWFAPGHAPDRRLPLARRRWRGDPAGGVRRVGTAVARAGRRRAAPLPESGEVAGPVPDRLASRRRRLSPVAGRRAEVTPRSRCAPRAAGGGAVRWIVDGVPHRAGRWSLQSGAHRFRAVSAAGDVDEVSVRVE